MRVITPNEEIIKESNSIFLAGTTARTKRGDWRNKVIEMLVTRGYDGVIYNPDYSFLKRKLTLRKQIEWELKAMDSSAVVAFWIDRDFPSRPGLTTNVEFGYYLPRSNMVYGRPKRSERCAYLDQAYLLRQNREPVKTLEAFVDDIIDKLKV